MTSPNPTPDEIAAECAKIQQGWSAAEELSRRVGRPSPVEMRRGSFADESQEPLESPDP